MRHPARATALVAAFAVAACSGSSGGGPGGVDAGRSSLAASPDTATADGASAVTLVATARDAGGTGRARRVATFAVSGAGNELSAASATTDAAGEASVTLTSTHAEEKTVSVNIDGVDVAQQLTVTFTAGPAARLVFTVDPSGGTAGSIFSPPVEVALEDAFGNRVTSGSESVFLWLQGGRAGATLSGADPASTAGGVAAFSALSVDKAGTGYTLLASAAGLESAASGTFSILPADPDAAMSEVAADPTSLAAGGTSDLIVTVRDAHGNPVPDATVTFEATGIENTISDRAVTDEAGGAGGALSSSRAEEKTITATVGGLALTDRPVVTFTAGPADAAGSSLVATPGSAADDGTLIVLTATVGDRYGNPVADEAVNFSSSGTASFTQPEVPTYADGSVTGAVGALVAGGQTIFAHVGSLVVARTDVSFTAAPPNAATSTVEVAPTSAPADGTSAAIAAVTAKDVLGRPVADATIVLSYSGAATITPERATTGADGVATFALTSSTPGTGGLTAKANPGAGEVVLAQSRTLRFTATSFTIGGFVFGLHADGLVLATSGQPDLAVQGGATTFAFATMVPSGTAYDVTVKAQPDGQTCNILHPSGTVASSDAIRVVVDCDRRWKQVATADVYAVAVTTDGSLYAWGNNAAGQLGDGSFKQHSFPLLIGRGFASVSASTSHAVAIKSDGSLYAWGTNSHGEIGDGSTTPRSTPILIGKDFASASAGYGHTVAVKTDGSLWAWGWNYYGQLGDGSTVNRTTPVLVGSGFASAFAGDWHSFAIESDGSLYGWGHNSLGQLGDGSTLNRTTPLLIGSDFAHVSTAGSHTVAIKTDGSLYAWGDNNHGQLGDGSTVDRMTPLFIGSGFAAVSAAHGYTVAVKTDGSLYAWGWNYSGQLGDGSRTIRYLPVLIGSGFASASAAYDYALAVKLDGSLHGWGHNEHGQLGDGSQLDRSTPVLNASDVVSVAAGINHALAVKTDSSLHAWGGNEFGQLGDGSKTDRTTPGLVGSGYDSVAAGNRCTLAVRTNGSLYAWGLNGQGQLGDGSQLQRSDPTLVGSGFASVSAGGYHTVAVTTDGSLFAWGYNAYGQVGDGSTASRALPVLIGSEFASMATGDFHTLAVKTDGSLYAWGWNAYGQLGDGSQLQRNAPVLIGSDFAKVSAGSTHTVALKTDGSLYAWGRNVQGQLGNGSMANSASPVLVGTGFASIAAGGGHTVAVKADGSLYAWGSNGDGELGDGSWTSHASPVFIGSGFASVAAGPNYTLAVRLDGSLWVWGGDEWGQLGDGRSDVLRPQPVPGVPVVFGLSYAANPVTYVSGAAIEPNVPTSKGGPITSYEVTPALPDGLFLDTATGILSGRPASPSTTMSYVVTGRGPTGTTTALLTIAVN